ncbi:schlafen-like protein 2 isoform X2 [Babylonia areolata]|uniref:schlafen-like protein 2 isoform X2 n=1 Tax=Babylonia areolata TaxID=304850 RepID=UPI003FD6A417
MASVRKFRKYYTKGDILPFEEDNRNEFKGHLNLCKEEIPVWAKGKKTERSTRKPISRNLNAFLNSGTGGMVFLGVVDDGKILGFMMTVLQRDHFVKALDDVFSRYKPKVNPHQYSVHFTPVFNKATSTEEIGERLVRIEREEMPAMYKGREHILRDSNFCWCDKDSVANLNLTSSEGQEYVVEVVIHPWDPSDPRNPSVGQGALKFQPYYSDEDGRVYFRRQASVVQVAAAVPAVGRGEGSQGQQLSHRLFFTVLILEAFTWCLCVCVCVL